MKITKAVITAAGRDQRSLHTQRLTDRDGAARSVLGIIVAEARRAGIEEIGVVIYPGDEERYREAAGVSEARQMRFIPQNDPRGYGHALYCSRDFVGDAPFLHMIGDHVYINDDPTRDCAQQIVQAALENGCSVSGVQPTRESLLPYFGTVGGSRVTGNTGLYRIDRVMEKPTPTEAEQTLAVPGLRAGNYLCFFGIHALTPTLFSILEEQLANTPTGQNIGLSPALNELAQREKYLALEAEGRRYALDTRYGLLNAQLALALSGNDRDEILTQLVELLAQREMGR